MIRCVNIEGVQWNGKSGVCRKYYDLVKHSAAALIEAKA